MRTAKRDHYPDLHDYDSLIKRSDGRVPYNGYLWALPDDSWWIAHEDDYKGFPGLWNFGVVALNDGRWSVDGTVGQIAHNDANYLDSHLPIHTVKPVVFETRVEAIRVAAARMIRDARAAARIWEINTLSPDKLEILVNWALAIVCRESDRPARSYSVFRLPPVPEKTGLDLWDFEPQKTQKTQKGN